MPLRKMVELHICYRHKPCHIERSPFTLIFRRVNKREENTLLKTWAFSAYIFGREQKSHR
jgi:hypothetical protein